MLADQQVGVRSVCAPAHRPVEKLLALELRHESRDRFSNACFGCVWVGIGGMFGV